MNSLKLRKAKLPRKSGGHYTVHSIGVPNSIAELIPTGTRFVPSLTEEGLLFKPVKPEDEQKRPAWAAPKRGRPRKVRA